MYLPLFTCMYVMYSISSHVMSLSMTASSTLFQNGSPTHNLTVPYCCLMLISLYVGVVKIGIIFTDGRATRTFEHHLPTLDNLGVTIFAIPINSRWYREGLEKLASAPPGLHVLTSRGVHSADYLVDTLLGGRLCRGTYTCLLV